MTQEQKNQTILNAISKSRGQTMEELARVMSAVQVAQGNISTILANLLSTVQTIQRQ